MKTQENPITLFLIEDDDIDAMTISRSFAKQKIKNPIVRAYDGLEALEMLRAGQVPYPYVILLDLQMPRMNGLEFLEELRKDEQLSSSIVFVLTTSKVERDIDESYKQHIAGYYVKDDAGLQFMDIVDVFDGYWRIVHMPKSPIISKKETK